MKRSLMKKKWWLIAMIVSIITLTACQNSIDEALRTTDGTGEMIEITHRSGVTSVPVNPTRIAVFDMAILDSLAFMGFSDRVVGLPQNSLPYLVQQFGDGTFADFGTLHEPNLEYMAGYDLDLIIISGRARPFFEELSTLAPTIDLGLDNSDIQGSFVANQTYLGQIFQAEASWTTALNEILDLFEEATELSGRLVEETALIIMHNEGNLQAFGPGGRFGMIHDVFGVPYVDATVGLNDEGENVNHGMTVSNEYIYSVNPSFIFVIDRNYVLAGQDPENHEIDITNDIINLTDAGKTGHIFTLNTEAWYIAPGGLQSMRQQVSGIIAGLREMLN